MKIIIAGAGEVGFHLAKLLSYESQEITLIDTRKDSLGYAGEHLDIKTIKGDGHAGVGLTIVKNLVNEMHGSISCRSSDKGTSFHILLPRNTQE